MDGNRFDEFTKSLAAMRSRRSLLKRFGLITGAAIASAIGFEPATEAASVCRSGKKVCRKHDDCCSGTCGPKDRTGRRRCAAAVTCPDADGTACCPSGICPQPNLTSICCGHTCVANNELNCGVCGNSCGGGDTCCPISGPVQIGSPRKECADLQTSEQHCGTCGNACAVGEICCGGRCVVNDANVCSACGISCPNGYPHATVTCKSSADSQSDHFCFFDCNDGWEDCNGDIRDGCEKAVPPLSDSSCGVDLCNRAACPSGTVCVTCGNNGAGTCCPPGYICGADSSHQCPSCVLDTPSAAACSIDPSRGGRYLR